MNASPKNFVSLRVALALSFVFVAMPAPRPAGADDAQPAANVLAFDEIDHVYTSGAIPPPGSFEHDLTLVLHKAASQQHKTSFLQGVMRAANVTGTQLGNVSSVVGSSGAIGQALGIANGAARIAPMASALGMIGGGHFAALLQTYALPRVSPTAAVMLSGFLAARTDYQARYPGASAQGVTASADAAAASPSDDPFARGSLRRYTIAANGWVRIDDPDTGSAVVIKPDIGQSYAIDDVAHTIHTASYDASAPDRVQAAVATSSASVADSVAALPSAQLDRVDASGFRTQSTVAVVAKSAGCDALALSSTRVEYFAPYRVAPAANTSPLASTPANDTCVIARHVIRHGPPIPQDQLMVYQANTIEKKTMTGTDRYTIVIERGNLHVLSAAARTAFDLPSDYRQI